MSVASMLKTAACAVAACLALSAGPAAAEWRRAETAHFIVYGDVPERTIRRYAQRAERFDALLRAYLKTLLIYCLRLSQQQLGSGRERGEGGAFGCVAAEAGDVGAPDEGVEEEVGVFWMGGL